VLEERGGEMLNEKKRTAPGLIVGSHPVEQLNWNQGGGKKLRGDNFLERVCNERKSFLLGKGRSALRFVGPGYI